MAGTVGNRTHPSGFGDRLANLGTFAPILVGQGGADPPTPEGSGFTVLETRIELEIYMFENLDCSL